MPIIHLIPQLRFGAGRYVVDLAARQARTSGDEAVAVLVSTDAEAPFRSDQRLVAELRGAGVRVEVAGDFFHRTVPGMRDAALQVAGAAGTSRPWLAHAHTALAAAVARRAGARVVVGTCHGVAQGRPEALDLQDALAWQSCDVVTSPSRHWAARLTESFAVEHPLVLPYGLNLATYPRHARPPRHAANNVRLVSIAEQTHRKGLDVLLDALPLLWRHFPAVECHLFGDGDEAANLRAQAARLDAKGHRVVFHGHQPRPYDSLGEFDIFVLPTRSDNQPIAAIEAMLAGLPAVVTGVGGLGELVLDGRCGWVVPPDDAAALAGAMEEAVAAGPSVRANLGAAGETFARGQFDIDAAARAMNTLYERMWQRQRE